MATGEVRRYYLATGSVHVLLPHPSMQITENPSPAFGDDDGNEVNNAPALDGDDANQFYNARTMKLSLKNPLVQHPKDAMECGVL